MAEVEPVALESNTVQATGAEDIVHGKRVAHLSNLANAIRRNYFVDVDSNAYRGIPGMHRSYRRDPVAQTQ